MSIDVRPVPGDADMAAGFSAIGGPDAYTSEALLTLEQQRMFSRTWCLVASTDELAEPGSYAAVTAGGAPLVVVRDGDGTLRAFHNLCRHRGAPLVSGSGKLGRHLTCPYHQWSFSLDGSLRQVPQADEQFPGLDKAEWGLHPADLAEWAGMVFVRASDDGPSFPDWVGPIADRLAGFLSGPLVQVACVEYEARCNWKLMVENHIDVYHLWYLHARSLGHLDHRVFHWENLGEHWWSQEPFKDSDAAGPGLPWLAPGENALIGAHLLFPNLMLVTSASYLGTYDSVPLAPDRTRLTLRIRAQPGTRPEPLVEEVRSFMSEDVEICEQIQLATNSPRFGFGPLARTHELPIRRFHADLRRHLGGD